MYPATCTIETGHLRGASLTRRERRLVRRLINTDPICLRQAMHNQQIGRTAERLLAAYRNEMLNKLRASIEVSLRDEAPVP